MPLVVCGFCRSDVNVSVRGYGWLRCGRCDAASYDGGTNWAVKKDFEPAVTRTVMED